MGLATLSVSTRTAVPRATANAFSSFPKAFKFLKLFKNKTKQLTEYKKFSRIMLMINDLHYVDIYSVVK